jgi:hypothetical protein
MPLSMTSPTTRAVLSPWRGMASYQSPPISARGAGGLVAAGNLQAGQVRWVLRKQTAWEGEGRSALGLVSAGGRRGGGAARGDRDALDPRRRRPGNGASCTAVRVGLLRSAAASPRTALSRAGPSSTSRSRASISPSVHSTSRYRGRHADPVRRPGAHVGAARAAGKPPSTVARPPVLVLVLVRNDVALWARTRPQRLCVTAALRQGPHTLVTVPERTSPSRSLRGRPPRNDRKGI